MSLETVAAGEDASSPLARLSVVIVSRHRPRRLEACLTALSRQDHPDFEIVVVADPASVGLRPELALKRVTFDEANISAARNAGIRAASGAVIAFIDDDALAVPSWAGRLAAAFADPAVIAATGATRGPDGFRWQVRAERIGTDGLAYPVAVAGPVSLAPHDGDPVSTIGTNCAFRATALRAIGGFDPAFRYHLDESDVNRRLAARFPDALTAIIPAAEVVHGAAAGPVRASAGVPSDLRQIGRSTALFVRRFGGKMPDLEALQRKRLLRLMVAGRLDPFAVAPLLAGLRQGIAEGEAEGPPALPSAPLPENRSAFLRFAAKAPVGRPVIRAGWLWQARALRREAAALTAQGRIVCLILWSPTVLPPRLTLGRGGWWELHGGRWGARDRAGRETGPADCAGGGGLPPAAHVALAISCRLSSRLRD